MKNKQKLNLQALRKEWYKKLASKGFEDAENLDGTLKDYHSVHFCSEETQNRKTKKEPYQGLIEEFQHTERFNQVCKSISKITRKGAMGQFKMRLIWKQHCEGLSEREIASNLKVSKTCIHKILEKFRAWLIVSR